MSDYTPGFNPQPLTPEPKKNNMGIIIAVVVVVLCCCCLVMGSFGMWLWNNGDQLLEGVKLLNTLPVV